MSEIEEEYDKPNKTLDNISTNYTLKYKYIS